VLFITCCVFLPLHLVLVIIIVFLAFLVFGLVTWMWNFYKCIQYLMLDYITLNMSGSENAVGFVRTGCRCGLVSGRGKTVI
jgi:hypothetical protein